MYVAYSAVKSLHHAMSEVHRTAKGIGNARVVVCSAVKALYHAMSEVHRAV